MQWTDSSMSVTKGITKVQVRKKTEQKQTSRNSEAPLAYDPILFKELSKLRSQWAEELQVPAFVVFGDRTLMEMASIFPKTEEQMLAINGVGPIKWIKYGSAFVELIKRYCSENPVPIATKEFSRVQQLPEDKRLKSSDESVELYLKGHSLEKIAEKRRMSKSTIVNHLCEQIVLGKELNIESLVSKERQQVIQQAIDKVGSSKLLPIKEVLGEDFAYDEIRLVVAKGVASIQNSVVSRDI